jgi:uncharacterized membrane protein
MLGLLYSVLRFLIDFTRVYGSYERVGPLSHNQVVCVVLFIIFGAFLLRSVVANKKGAVAGGGGNDNIGRDKTGKGVTK